MVGRDEEKEGVGRGDCCQRLNQINIFVLFSFCCGYVFLPVTFLFFSVLRVCGLTGRGRGIRWCDKAAGGNLISFSVCILLLSVSLAFHSRSQKLKLK